MLLVCGSSAAFAIKDREQCRSVARTLPPNNRNPTVSPNPSSRIQRFATYQSRHPGTKYSRAQDGWHWIGPSPPPLGTPEPIRAVSSEPPPTKHGIQQTVQARPKMGCHSDRPDRARQVIREVPSSGRIRSPHPWQSRHPESPLSPSRTVSGQPQRLESNEPGIACAHVSDRGCKSPFLPKGQH